MRANYRHLEFVRNNLKTHIYIKWQGFFPGIAPKVIRLLPAQVNQSKIEQLITKAPAAVFFNGSHAAQLVARAGKIAVMLRAK